MQFQVPQNITMEDRIIGPLNPLQFTIVVLGGLASFTLITSKDIPAPLNQIAGGLLALVTVTMALGKFNDQPLYKFMRYIVAFIASPKVRVWHKHGGQETQLIKPNPSSAGKQVVHVTKNVSHGDIARLAAVLDSRGTVGAAPKIEVKTRTQTVPAKPEPRS